MNTRSIASIRRALLFLAITAGTSAASTAQRVVIDFNDPAGLLAIPGDCARSAICPGAPLTFANSYREDGMLFTDGVTPPDPALRAARANHYHLGYEDPSISYEVVQGQLRAGRRTAAGFTPLTNPENENRTLGPHHPGVVIQMTYDPNNDGVPDPFNLISLVVHTGKLNVGTLSPNTGISVYNNLTGGFTWSLIDATNLTRATLEVPVTFGGEGIFSVDQIVFEPVSATPAPPLYPPYTIRVTRGAAEATPTTFANVQYVALDPVLFETVELAAPTFGSLAIEDARVERPGPAQDRFEIRGTLTPGASSDGVLDAATEEIVVTFGDFRELVPAGLLACVAGTGTTQCDFNGRPGGITAMHLELPLASAPGPVRFDVSAQGLDLSALAPEAVPLAVQIGSDLGVTTQAVSVSSPLSATQHD
jgi:hypothetical protein